MTTPSPPPAPPTSPPSRPDRARWQQLSPLIDELLDLPEPERAQRLQALQAEAPTLAAELQPWLQELADLADSGFMQSPAQRVQDSAPTPATDPLAQQRVGAYTLVRELGRGGMGSVWLARRTDGRYEGEVAIKFLQPGGAASSGVAGRFEREGRILARLAHPHIARLLDAGHVEAGVPGPVQPYLVLEYVPGLPIDQHCQQQALPLAARLRLFMDVLDAVAHAHNRLILHRDLKPSNILVSPAGEVKLLDFGIAKLLDPADTAQMPELTQQAGNAYTLQYAAPEQLQGGEVTTATDVYALGVLLFKLLSGRLPIQAHQADQADRLALWRAVVEQPAPRLSEAARAVSDSRDRGWQALQGDLDTIVAKALKKLPAERYANAAALAADLQRHLHHLPIVARPDRWTYRSAKFLRRHRLAVGAGSLAALALAASTALAVHEARQARTQQAQAEGLIEFMLGDLPAKLKPVGRLDVLDAVGDRALAYYAAQRPGSLNAASLGRRARALHLMGEITEQSGRFEEAARSFTEAAASTAELLARHPGQAEHLFNHAQSSYWVGFIAYRRGRHAEAEAAFSEYLALAEALVAQSPDNLDWQTEVAYAGQNLGVLQLEASRPAQALQAFERTRAAWQPVVQARPDMALELANTWGWIAKAHEAAQAYPAALLAQQAKLQALQQVPDAERNTEVQELQAVAGLDITQLHLALGETDAALVSARSAVDLAAALVRQDGQNLAWTAVHVAARLGMAETLLAAGRQDEARAALAPAGLGMQRLLAAAEPRLRWSLNLQGRWLALRAPLAQGPAEQRAVAQALLRFLDGLPPTPSSGARLDAEQSRVAAAAGLALGALLKTQGADAEAHSRWAMALGKLQPGLQRREWPAMALAAALQQRLGAAQEALALVEEVRAGPYRHPLLAEARTPWPEDPPAQAR